MERDALFDWPLPIDKWSEEQLEAWAGTLNADTIPQINWHLQQVLMWARKVLEFSDASAAALIKNKMDGQCLFKTSSKQDLLSGGFPLSAANNLWEKIEALKESEKAKNSLVESDPTEKLVQDYSLLRISTSTRTNDALIEYQRICQNIINKNTPKKSVPTHYSMSPAARQVVSKVKNLGLPILVAKDIILMTTEERITAILEDIPKNIKVNKPVPKVHGLLMPLSDRAVAKQQVMDFFAGNTSAVFKENDDKIYHSFCTVLGGSGIGKTRLCHEIITWGQEFMKTSQPITKLVPVYIDFSKGDGLVPGETSALHMIGQRIAAREIYHCNTQELHRVLMTHQDLLLLFDFNTVMEAVRQKHPTNVCGILLILDEFNYVVQKDKEIANTIIRVIGSFMAESGHRKDTVLFPVIAGTVEAQVCKSFINSSYRNRPVSLPPLSYSSIDHLFRKCLPTSYHKWLEFIPFRRMLLLMCSTPRALHSVLTTLGGVTNEPSPQNVQALGLSLQHTLMDKVSQSLDTLFGTAGFRELLQFVLAGTHFSLIQQNSQLVEDMEVTGILYRSGESIFLPYHIVWQANASYGKVEMVKSLKPLVDPRVIPNPGARFTWQMFEHLDHALDPVRVSALRTIKISGARISELFKGALYEEKTGERELQLQPIQCVIESSQFIPKKGKAKVFEEIWVTEGSSKITSDKFFDYTFMCSTGNPHIDSRLFFRTTTGKPIMFIKELKHLESAEKKTSIPFLYVENWFKVALRRLLDFSTTYDIYGIFITNKKITNLPVNVWPVDRLIIVHADNIDSYYGPFVAQLAHLTTFQAEHEELNEVESSDEEYFTFNEDAEYSDA